MKRVAALLLTVSACAAPPPEEPTPAPATSGSAVVVVTAPGGNVNGTPPPPPAPSGPLELDFAGVAGGPLSGSSVGASCTSSITVTPSHTFWSPSPFEQLIFTASSTTDTVMIVRSPSGVVTCDDDGGGYPNPRVWVAGEVGRYEIWMGTYASGASGTYTLHVSSEPPATTGMLGALGGSTIPGVPTECGMSVPDYGPIRIGSSVVLGAHTGWTGPAAGGVGWFVDDTWWNDAMWAYVGQRTVVTEYGGLDPAGCPYVRTAIDGGSWGWRIRNLSP